MLGDVGQAAALRPDERHRRQPVVAGPAHRPHEVRGVAADAHAEGQVARPGVILELAEEHVLERVIVPQGRHPGGIVVQRQDAEPARRHVGGAFAEVGREMGGVGGAAAVAEDENLRPLIPGPAQQRDDARDLFERQRGVGLLLPVPILHQPASEMRHGSIPMDSPEARSRRGPGRGSWDSMLEGHRRRGPLEASTSTLRVQSRTGRIRIEKCRCDSLRSSAVGPGVGHRDGAVEIDPAAIRHDRRAVRGVPEAVRAMQEQFERIGRKVLSIHSSS